MDLRDEDGHAKLQWDPRCSVVEGLLDWPAMLDVRVISRQS